MNSTLILLLMCCLGLPVYGQMDSIKAALQKQPDNIGLKYQLGLASLKRGNVDTAEVLFNEVIKAASQKNDNKNFVLAKIQVGRICADKGENVKALAHYQQALTKAESSN